MSVPPTLRPGGPVPGDEWSLAADAPRAAVAEIDALMTQPEHLGLTLAVVLVQGGRIVHEAYSPTAGPGTPLVSWSMAKSVTHALVGMAVADGSLDLGAPAPVPEWQDDVRSAITLEHLMEMRSGLTFVEDYVDDSISHCIDMLFGTGKADVASYAAALPLEHAPGTHWSYSSGTTNIVCRILGDVAHGGPGGSGAERSAAMRALLQRRLFAPLGMNTADPRFDEAGTFIGSSFLYASARDFARFGLLYLRDGVWGDRRVLPAGWSDDARRPTPVPPEEGVAYGRHWWLWDQLGRAKPTWSCRPRSKH